MLKDYDAYGEVGKVSTYRWVKNLYEKIDMTIDNHLEFSDGLTDDDLREILIYIANTSVGDDRIYPYTELVREYLTGLVRKRIEPNNDQTVREWIFELEPEAQEIVFPDEVFLDVPETPLKPTV